jgi:hypothetical protein
VACISLTASSMETPLPSFKISTPKIFMLAAAPFSLAPARVMSKGKIWSEYQGTADSLKPPRAPEMAITRGMLASSIVAPTGMPLPRVVWASKMAVSSMNWLSAARNWGRMSSMLAMNLPAAFRTTFSKA